MLSNTRLRAAAGRSSMLEALELTFYSISHAIQTSRKIKECNNNSTATTLTPEKTGNPST